MAKRKFFIDTDAGTDDAIAIIMAMKQPDIEVVGITTSGGNVPLDCVVQNVLYIREICNYATKVFVGAAQPISRILGTADFIHGKDGLGDIGLDLKGRIPEAGNGPEELARCLSEHPNEIELICLGPLTNMALADQHRPGVLKLAKRIYIMGGLVDLPGNVTPLAEYNIWADPEAANVVFSSGATMSMIGWDTTIKSGDVTIEEMKEIRKMNTPLSIFAADIQRVRIQWMEEEGHEVHVYLADAVAMAAAIDDGLVTNRENFTMTVGEGDDEDPNRGFITCVKSETEGSIDFIHTLDRTGFMDMMIKSLM